MNACQSKKNNLEVFSQFSGTSDTRVFYQLLFQQNSQAMWVADVNGILVEVNVALLKITGRSAADLIGKSVESLVCHDEVTRQRLSSMWVALDTEAQWEGEFDDANRHHLPNCQHWKVTTVSQADGDSHHYLGVVTDVSDFKFALERVDYLAHHDTLTDLNNRFSLEMKLDQSIANAMRKKLKLAILYIDLDRFKTINDTLGHHAGDELLIAAAERLRSCVPRSSDIIARIGGDEFVVVLNDIDQAASAGMIAEVIVMAMEEAFSLSGKEVFISSSVGVAMYPQDGLSSTELLQKADKAMYHAKQLGRNNLQFFSGEINDEVENTILLERALRSAVAEQQLSVAYQPQFNVKSQRTLSFEALLRWQHPQLGEIVPERFIPIAEASGQIGQLGDYVIEEVCKQLHDWRQAGIEDVRVAINISMHQLTSASLVEVLASTMAKYGVSPRQLELEITETVAMKDPDFIIQQLEKVNKLGIELSIDDFGTGYSSMCYLKMLPISCLKIDKNFVRNMLEDDNDRAICNASISLAHSMDLTVVAEGVEEESQKALLIDMGCDILQGYYLSEPVVASDAIGYYSLAS